MSDTRDGRDALLPFVLTSVAVNVPILILILKKSCDAHQAILTRESSHAAEFADHDTRARYGG